MGEPTLLLAVLTAGSYLVGSAYLTAYYRVYGLALPSLNVPAADIFFASALVLAALWATGLMIIGIPDPPSRQTHLRKGPAWLRRIPIDIQRAIVFHVLGIVLFVFKWTRMGGHLFVFFGMVCLANGVFARGTLYHVLYRAAAVCTLIYGLAGLAGEVAAAPDGQGSRRVVLHTATDWAFKERPMFPLLHRDGLWYVVEPGNTHTYIIPDTDVLRAEQYAR